MSETRSHFARWAPLAAAMIVASAYNWTIERLAYKPLRGSFRLAPLISAIGMSVFLQNYVQIAQGARVKDVSDIAAVGRAANDLIVEILKLREKIVDIGNGRRNVGIRLLPHLRGAFIHAHVAGSDHCPVGVDLDDAVLGAG